VPFAVGCRWADWSACRSSKRCFCEPLGIQVLDLEVGELRAQSFPQVVLRAFGDFAQVAEHAADLGGDLWQLVRPNRDRLKCAPLAWMKTTIRTARPSAVATELISSRSAPSVVSRVAAMPDPTITATSRPAGLAPSHNLRPRSTADVTMRVGRRHRGAQQEIAQAAQLRQGAADSKALHCAAQIRRRRSVLTFCLTSR
jgi:hypothetical protein